MQTLALISPALLATLAFVLGTIIASFLNVYLYRFHTGRSLGGSSHCLSCGQQLRWFELVPLLSYLALRGRCARCGSSVPPHYLFVELCGGLLFAAAALASPTPLALGFSLLLCTLLLAIVVYDIYHMVIPDEFLYGLLALAALEASAAYWVSGDPLSFLPALLGALGATSFFFGLWYVSRGRWMGFGDVKLVAPLAFLAGIPGVFSMVVLAFWVGAAVSLALLAGQRLRGRGQRHLRFLTGRLTMKSEVPFAPFLVAGFLLVYLAHLDVLTLLFYALS